MLIQASWPGASIEEMTSQVTDRIEKKLQELDNLDFTKSVNAPGQATIYVNLLDTTKASDVKPTWVKVRNMIADIAPQLPRACKVRPSSTVSATCSAIYTPSHPMA